MLNARRSAKQGILGALIIIFPMAAHARPYRPHCWSVAEIEDAKVMELSVSLNVRSLRCRHESTAIIDRYEAYNTSSLKVMAGVSKVIRKHFGSNKSLYDQYSIGLANKYGAGKHGQTCADFATVMERAIGGADTLQGLSQVAETDNINPDLDGGACPLHPATPFIVRPPRRVLRHSHHVLHHARHI